MTLEQFIAPYALLGAIVAAGAYALYAMYRGGRVQRVEFWPQVETCAVLAMVYGACAALNVLYERWDLYWQFGFVDVLAGVGLWAIYEQRWQRAVIGLFAAMLLVHIGYGFALWLGNTPNQLAYNRTLNALFYMQILIPVIATWLRRRRKRRGYVGLVDTASAWLLTPCGPGAQTKARG